MFVEWMKTFSKSPILGVLLGTVMTVMVQSSSASMGILMSLLAVGVIDYHAAVPVLLGDNIGTTITALLSSIGANRNAKRSAAAHMIFNVIGTFTFLLFLYLIPNLTELLHQFFSLDYFGQNMSSSRILANTHSAFNILNALIWLPFIGVIVKIVNLIVPGEEEEIGRGLTHLDERMLETPSLAVEQAEHEVLRMFNLAREMLEDTMEAFENQDIELIKVVHNKEDIINELEEKILVFLTKIPHDSLSEEDIRIINMYFAVIDAIESIADDADELAKLTTYRYENKLEYSKEAKDSIDQISKITFNLLDKTVTSSILCK